MSILLTGLCGDRDQRRLYTRPGRCQRARARARVLVYNGEEKRTMENTEDTEKGPEEGFVVEKLDSKGRLASCVLQ